MRRMLYILTTIITIALVATACGDDASETSVGSDPVPDDTIPDDTIPDDTVPDEGGQPLGAGPYPIADLTITAHTDSADDGTAVTYRLACLGDTATVTGDSASTSAEVMCLALNDDGLRSRLISGPPADQGCTMIYGGPESARIVGTLDGQTVDATVDRTNGCGIAEWSGLLADLLPPAAS